MKFVSKIDSIPFLGPLVFVTAVLLAAMLPLALVTVGLHKAGLTGPVTLAQ